MVTATESDTQAMWDSETTYAYGDVVRYTNNGTTYKCTSLRDGNTNNPPVTSDGKTGGGVAWKDATYDETASIIDESVLAGTGYAYSAEARNLCAIL